MSEAFKNSVLIHLQVLTSLLDPQSLWSLEISEEEGNSRKRPFQAEGEVLSPRSALQEGGGRWGDHCRTHRFFLKKLGL